MVLLDLLVQQAKSPQPKVPSQTSQASGLQLSAKDFRLVVAHYDHGIREDSKVDRLFVQQTARTYGLPFVYDKGSLGPRASEAQARTARYGFLEAARQATQAQAIVTAHHQDDQLETAFINSLRGTGRRGLTALRSRLTLLRPLLGTPKSELLAYAQTNGIKWHEDSTNKDARYLRNHIRRHLLSKLPAPDRDQLTHLITELMDTNDQIDRILVNHLHTQPVPGELNRQWFIMLPHVVATEIMMTWLRAHDVDNLDKKRLELLTAKAKTLDVGKRVVVDANRVIEIGKDSLALAVAER